MNLMSWLSLSLRIANEHPWVLSAIQWEGIGYWLFGLELRGMGKDVEYLQVFPKPLVDVTEQGYECH